MQPDADVVYSRLATHFKAGGPLHMRQVLLMFDMPSERVRAALVELYEAGDILGRDIEHGVQHPMVITGVRPATR